MTRILSHSVEETIAIGYALGKKLLANSVVCFFGDLGSGKTTYIKGLVAGATQLNSHIVSSPTFIYLNIYEGIKTVYHFDLYRLHDADEFLSMGFDEFFFAQGICCVEWSEKIVEFLPKNSIKVIMSHAGDGRRWIEVS